MGKLQMYAYYFRHFITRGKYIGKNIISVDGLIPRYGVIQTRNYSKKIILLQRFVPLNYGDPVARIVRAETIQRFPGVRVIVNIHGTPKKINIKDMVYLNRYNRAEELYHAYRQEFSTMSGSEKVSGRQYRLENGSKFVVSKSEYLKARDTYYSYQYVTDCKNQGIQLFEVTYAIELLIPVQYKIDDVVEFVLDILTNKEGINVKLIESQSSEYLSEMGASAYKKNKYKFPSMLFSSQHLAINSSYLSPGLTGNGDVLVGLDQKSQSPFVHNFFNSGGAKVVLVTGTTGSGKTEICFNLCLGFTGQDIHCSALDFKGNEWIKLGALGVPYKVFHIGAKTGTYVNFLRLDDQVTPNTPDAEFKILKESAITATTKLLTVMTNLQENEGNLADVEHIIRDSVCKLYAQTESQFSDRMDFVQATSKLTYKHVIDIIHEKCVAAVSNKEDTANYDEEYARICRLCVVRCNPYVENYTGNGAIFKHELTVKEILDTPLIIYSLDKNQDGHASVEDTVGLFMIQYLDMKKQYLRRLQGKFTAAFYEEVQRCGNIKSITDFMSANVTGSRSNNLAIFLLMNALSTFESQDFAAIKSNITMHITGKMLSQDVHKLINEYDCMDIREDLYKINPDADPNNKERDDSFIYRDYGYCFVVKYRKNETMYDSTIVKVEFPPEIMEQLKTATNRDVN